ncbi:hypothetical protein VNO80_13287 [Phaseolus coccineus]|uniref:Trichome birefringence-like C-terminal domain-containing protein n=1 Tax=Phaseolus coccineus TaxID=3886 RepID=A0AAN9R6V6_PHACN
MQETLVWGKVGQFWDPSNLEDHFQRSWKDGRPSIYGTGGHRGLDCSHWCLPGVPDTWNVLLYDALIQK